MKHTFCALFSLLLLSLSNRHAAAQPYLFDGIHTVNAGNTEAKELTLETMAANGYGKVKVGDTNPNYWGTGVTPGATEFPDVDYNTPVPASGAFTYGYVTCGGQLTGQKEKRIEVQGMAIPSDLFNDCLQQYYRGSGLAQSTGHRKAGYDTLKRFVETCAPEGKVTTWDAFPNMDGAIQYMGGPMTRYLEYRDWLKTVLYLDQIHPEYYCAAARSIVFTFIRDGSYTHNLPAQLAIFQYLLESGKCLSDSAIWRRGYDEGRAEQYKRWVDTTTVDTNLVKMDTTLPTLEELGLEILRGPLAVDERGDNASQALLDVRALVNPFSSSTEIEYTLGRSAQVEISLFNALGRVVWSKPFGGVEDATKHRIGVSGAELSSGVYFVRVSTLTGEVKTVQLIKE